MGRLLSMALVLTAIAAAVVIAAGGVDVREDAPGPAATAHAPATAAPARGARQHKADAVVRMRRLAFARAVVRIRTGQTVRWVNHDDVAHTIFVQAPGDPSAGPIAESRRIRPGATYALTLPAPGTYRVVCTLHPTVMEGRLLVGS